MIPISLIRWEMTGNDDQIREMEALAYRQRHDSESNRSPSFMISRTRRIA